MEISIFFAKFLGLYLLIIGLALLVRPSVIASVAADVLPALVFMMGIIALIFGLVIVILHNVWEPTWRVWITLIGYLAVVKGITRLFFPDFVDPLIKRFASSPAVKAMFFFMVLLGAYLTYQGFEAVIPVAVVTEHHEIMD